jgi:DNA-binding response OmpR family regulator
MATILLADDDLTLSEMYEERLKAEGLNVLVVHNGEDALKVAIEKKPDLILLDIMMPKVNGLDTLKNLRSHPETEKIPVIMLTALVQDANKMQGLLDQAQDYVVKSETMPGELIQKIHTFLDKKPTTSDQPAAEPIPTPQK